MSLDIKAINEKIQRESAFVDLLQLEIGKVIVGQKYMVERLLIGLLCQRPHPARRRAGARQDPERSRRWRRRSRRSSSGSSSRRTCCPADLIGTMIYNQKDGRFQTKKGPIFANFILADEINRAPAKVQSALLEAMQERQVTIGEQTFPLAEPFLVLATQNPIEQEGTYPLPEAQVDRFMLKVKIGYPSKEEELQIMRANVERPDAAARRRWSRRRTSSRRARVVGEIYMDEKIEKYILDIVFATRNRRSSTSWTTSRSSSATAPPRARRSTSRSARRRTPSSSGAAM